MSKSVKLEVIRIFMPPTDELKAALQAQFDKWYEDKVVLCRKPEADAPAQAHTLYQYTVDTDRKWEMRAIPMGGGWAIYKPNVTVGDAALYLESRKVITDILDAHECPSDMFPPRYTYNCHQVVDHHELQPKLFLADGKHPFYNLMVASGNGSTIHTHLPNGKDSFEIKVEPWREPIKVTGYIVAGLHRCVYDIRRRLSFWLRGGDSLTGKINAVTLAELVESPMDDHIWLITDKNKVLQITEKPTWLIKRYNQPPIDDLIKQLPFIKKYLVVKNLVNPGFNPDRYDRAEEINKALIQEKTLPNQMRINRTIEGYPVTLETHIRSQ